tara:strand:- start:246 stop:626 length:381 start_codon:yes stop_codon:yes gene_type:complete
MEELALKMVALVIGMFKSNPAVMIAATVASFIMMAQPLLRALVEWTPNKVDNKVLEIVLKIANLLTPFQNKRGTKAVKATDEDIVNNVLKEYVDPADVPSFVLKTLNVNQKQILADKYVKAATDKP